MIPGGERLGEAVDPDRRPGPFGLSPMLEVGDDLRPGQMVQDVVGGPPVEGTHLGDDGADLERFRGQFFPAASCEVEVSGAAPPLMRLATYLVKLRS